MKKKGMQAALALSAMLVAANIAGCSNENNVEETTAAEGTTGSDETKESPEETTPEETTSEEETTPEETTPEETTPEQTEPQEPQGEATVNAFKLMHMSLEEAREYYDVEEASDKTPEDFDEFIEFLFEESITTDRLTLDQYLQDAESYGIDYIDEIPYDLGSLIYTDDEIAEMKEVNTEELKELLSYPYEDLSARQQLVFDKLYYQYQVSLWSFDVTDYSSYIGITSGLISNLAITFYEYSFDTERNVDTYMKVMEYVPDIILEVPEHVKYQMEELGYAPTDYMLQTAMDSIEGLMELEENPFIDGFDGKIDALDLDEDIALEYKEDNKAFYEEKVIPALKQVYDELEDLLGSNEYGQGMCYYDGGQEYYEYLVESSVGSGMTVDEMMTLLDERINSDMKSLMRLAMFNYDDLMDYLDGNIVYPVEEDAQAIVDYFLENMSEDFPELGDVTYNVSYLPASLEVDGIVAYYLIPRLDSKAANVIRVNGSATNGDMNSLFMTLAHEGYPGHMLQFNVQQSCGAYNVEQLLSFLGYSEGWAMYAEHMCLNYTDLSDAVIQFILLDSDIGYNLCGYIDLAVNGKGWDVDDIYEYLDALDMGDREMAQSYFDMAVGDPGALLPYSLGYELTEAAIEEYVKDTNVTYREAYESFMSIGSAPFELVEKYLGMEF